jgi:hypothetical protein
VLVTVRDCRKPEPAAPASTRGALVSDTVSVHEGLKTQLIAGAETSTILSATASAVPAAVMSIPANTKRRVFTMFS